MELPVTNLPARIIDADVLVVGAGAAASRAATAAAESGARTFVTVKGKAGRSGASNYPGGGASWQAADECAGCDDSPEVHYQDIMHAALGMADARLAWILAHESPERLRELEDWGVAFRPDPTGCHPHLAGYACFGTQPRAHGLIGTREGGHTGNLVEVLMNRFQAHGGVLHEHTVVVDLLVEDNTCVGALAISPEGEFIAYRAGAVILATGGAAQMFSRSTMPGDITGDGYAMAFRAGAELTNLEFMQYMITVVAGKSPRLGGQFWSLNPTVLNGQGEEVLSRYLPSGITPAQAMADRVLHYPFSTRDASAWLDVAIETEIRAGRGTPRRGVVVDFTNIDLAQVRQRKEHHPLPETVTIRDRRIEVAHAAHAFNGGIRIDEWGQSTLPGLFAAGEVVAGPHGADRLGGAMVSQSIVFGARAGSRAAEYARSVHRSNNLRPETLARPVARLARFGQGTTTDWLGIRRALKSICAENLVVVRNRSGLEHALETIERLQVESLPRVSVPDIRTLVHVLELDDLLLTAQMTTRAALLRTESRGSHYREDYPLRNDARWQANLIWHNQHGKPVPFLGRYRQDPIQSVQCDSQRPVDENL